MQKPVSHSLYKPVNLRRLKIAAVILLSLSVLAEFFVPVHGHFSLVRWFGFTALSGLFASGLLIVIALFMALLLRRSEHYYLNRGRDDD